MSKCREEFHELDELRSALDTATQQAETRRLALDASVSSSCVLEAELAAEREKVDVLKRRLEDTERIHKTAFTGVVDALAAAQAVIERQREALLDVARKAEALKKECGMNPESPQAIRNGEYMNISYAARAAISAPTNQDALHEALAAAIENVGKIYAQKAQAVADTTLRHAYYAGRDVFEAEASAHRARKEGK